MLCTLQEAAYYVRILVTNFPVCVWKVKGRIPIHTQPIIKHQQNLQQFNSILTLYSQRWYQIPQVEGSAIKTTISDTNQKPRWAVCSLTHQLSIGVPTTRSLATKFRHQSQIQHVTYTFDQLAINQKF